jgi:hypothetical protein
MEINEKAKLLLGGACCECCYFYARKWLGSGNARVKRYCAHYLDKSGASVKRRDFNELKTELVDKSHFCEYYRKNESQK